MAVVGLPPAPAAIFVLEAVQAVETGADLLLKRRLVEVDLQARDRAPPSAR